MQPKENTLMSKMGFNDSELSTPEHDAIMAKLADDGFCMKIIEKFYTGGNVTKIIPQFEVPITTKSGYVVGVLDAKLFFTRPWSYKDWNGKEVLSSADEVIHIEIKPSVRSFGETMRQINVYREHVGHLYFLLLLSKETPFQKLFESQGVKVLVA